MHLYQINTWIDITTSTDARLIRKVVSEILFHNICKVLFLMKTIQLTR